MTVVHPPDGVADAVRAMLEESGALQTGHFVLSSGLHSDRYCQCAALFEDPARAARAAELMAELVRATGPAPDAVLAPAIGGVLWGYELARALGCRSIFAERPAPNEPLALRRGFAIRPGERVLLAEDVVTTGGSVLELPPLLGRAGAEVAAVCTVVDRSGGRFGARVADRFPAFALLDLHFDVYEPSNLPAWLAERPVEKPGSRGP